MPALQQSAIKQGNKLNYIAYMYSMLSTYNSMYYAMYSAMYYVLWTVEINAQNVDKFDLCMNKHYCRNRPFDRLYKSVIHYIV